MKATLLQDYICAPEGHTVLKFKAGMTLESPIAEMAIADGAAIEIQSMPDLETKIETTTKKGRYRK
jgi:hypothetical protein